MIRLLALFLFILFPAVVFAQDPATMPADLSADETLALILKLVGGTTGAKALGWAYAGVQGLMILLRSPLGNVTGKVRLLVYLALSLVAGVLAQKLAGVAWLAALTNSGTLTAAGLLVNQSWKQFRKAD